MSALVRNSWRQLTSMRTALVLLFLLAVASIPGSVLPQRPIGPEKVRAYLVEHPALGPWLDRLQAFDVFSSIWYSAIYLLLFASLLGCLVPRLRTHATALFRVPVNAPSRLDRLPVYADGIEPDGDPAATAQRLRVLLRQRRFRTVVRPEGAGFTVSGERGYLKESGNLLFHFALLGLLLGVAIGAWFGWHGNRVVVAGEEQGFCNVQLQYDEFVPGARIGPEDLPRFCVSLVDFQARYRADGQPIAYDARLRFAEPGGPSGERRVQVNHPLRLPDANVYLLGHGYAPIIRYTDRAGRTHTSVVPFLPRDEALTSYGLAAFPDANIGVGVPDGDKAQVAFVGTYLPTRPDDLTAAGSAFPAERNPRLFLRMFVGDLGLDALAPQSVYELNAAQVASGRLREVGDPLALAPGESAKLPDGSSVEFVGTRPWISVSVRHDPGEPLVFAGAVLLVAGLLASLTGRRRRIFFRVTADGVQAGGLARSEYPGFAAEFEAIVQAAAPGERSREEAGVRG
jgi:cytochrome c biogenesis protein